MSEPAFYRFRERLAQFRREAGDSAHWESRWRASDLESWLESHRRGRLDEFERIFLEHLPRDLPILEAGCGRGQLVMALHSRGYSIEGVDQAVDTVARLKSLAPELSFRSGDINALDVPDESYGGYISLGVLEHDPRGPLAGLLEARRVLHPRGVAFISVPFLNRRRSQWLQKVPIAESDPLPNELRFYQYYFSRAEFESYLDKAGLRTIDTFPYAVYSGLTRDFVLGKWLDSRSFFFWQLHRRVTRWCRQAPSWARWRWAHMMMFVCTR